MQRDTVTGKGPNCGPFAEFPKGRGHWARGFVCRPCLCTPRRAAGAAAMIPFTEKGSEARRGDPAEL